MTNTYAAIGEVLVTAALTTLCLITMLCILTLIVWGFDTIINRKK